MIIITNHRKKLVKYSKNNYVYLLLHSRMTDLFLCMYVVNASVPKLFREAFMNLKYVEALCDFSKHFPFHDPCSKEEGDQTRRRESVTS